MLKHTYNCERRKANLYASTEKGAQKVKEVAGMSEGEMKCKAHEVKGQAHEVAGQAKGKASELAGEAKGKKEEIKGKL